MLLVKVVELEEVLESDDDDELEELEDLEFLRERRDDLRPFLLHLTFLSLQSPLSSCLRIHKATFSTPLQATVILPGPSHALLGTVKTKLPLYGSVFQDLIQADLCCDLRMARTAE